MHKPKPVIGPDGEVYESIAAAARAARVRPGNIWYWCRQCQHGWRFADDDV